MALVYYCKGGSRESAITKAFGDQGSAINEVEFSGTPTFAEKLRTVLDPKNLDPTAAEKVDKPVVFVNQLRDGAESMLQDFADRVRGAADQVVSVLSDQLSAISIPPLKIEVARRELIDGVTIEGLVQKLQSWRFLGRTAAVAIALLLVLVIALMLAAPKHKTPSPGFQALFLLFVILLVLLVAACAV